MNCQNCGYYIQETYNFCGKCGEKINNNKIASTPKPIQSFKLKNKIEEQKIIEEQKRKTAINAQNSKLNVLQKNPQTTMAILSGITTLLLIIGRVGFLWVIPIIVGARLLLKAKRIGENKKYIIWGYIIIYLPVFFWISSSIYYAINMIAGQN